MRLRTLLDRVERATFLDGPARIIGRAVETLPRPARDGLHGVWLGHPLHPMAVMVPLGSWLGAAILDLAGTKGPAPATLIGVGTAGAIPAAVAGFNDWASLSPEQRRVGLAHAAANSVALALYAGSFVARRRGRTRTGRRLGFAGLAAAGLSGYIGGHLGYRQSSAVNHAAPYLRRIPEGWHDVCAYDELTLGKPRVVHIEDVPIMVVLTADRVTAMIELCGHQTGPLAEGEFVTVNGAECVVCPWHGSTFRLDDGAAVRGPAASSQPLLRSRIVGGRVEVGLP